MDGLKPAISLTESALKHLNKTRTEREKDLCLRIGVKQGGCPGMSYTMDFENRANARPDDSTIEYEGFAIDEVRVWRKIKGLRKLRKHPTRGLKTGSAFQLLDFGGKLFVMWDPYDHISGVKRSKKFWYAKISLESRRNGREAWGNVECVDVLTFPVQSYEETLFDCLTAAV